MFHFFLWSEFCDLSNVARNQAYFIYFGLIGSHPLELVTWFLPKLNIHIAISHLATLVRCDKDFIVKGIKSFRTCHLSVWKTVPQTLRMFTLALLGKWSYSLVQISTFSIFYSENLILLHIMIRKMSHLQLQLFYWQLDRLIEDMFWSHAFNFFRDMFDLSHKLFKTKKQLDETLQLIAITEQTNEVFIYWRMYPLSHDLMEQTWSKKFWKLSEIPP